MSSADGGVGSKGAALRHELNQWVEGELACYDSHSAGRIRSPKLVRDSLWDSHLFTPFEIHVLDCPLIQRLRGVSQTALAHLVYPGATHNRFQHSLGMAIVMDRIVRGLQPRLNRIDGKKLRESVRSLRLASLLHDVGHGAFSHASETFYGDDEGIQDWIVHLGLREHFPPHELLSYLIITSGPFRRFIEDVAHSYKTEVPDLEFIGRLIIGKPTDVSWLFISELVNGVFDADKLDYLSRDSHMTGVKLVIDVDRIANTVEVLRGGRSDGERHLGICINGAHAVEQIVFNKILLWTSVYHHHKVRASACMIHGLFETIQSNPEDCSFQLSSVVDYLRNKEPQFLDPAGKTNDVAQYIRCLSNRSLLKRALVLSPLLMLLDSDERDQNFHEFLRKCDEEPGFVLKLRRDLHAMVTAEGIDTTGSLQQYWFDIPAPLRFREPSQCLVRNINGQVELLHSTPSHHLREGCWERIHAFLAHSKTTIQQAVN